MRRAVRMLIGMVIFSCVLAMAESWSFAQESTASASQQAIIQLENHWLANEYNPAVLDAILADDFVHVVAQGMISKQEHIGFVRAHPQPDLAAHKFERLDVRVYGNVAIANGIVVAVPAGGGAEQRTLFTDVFALRDGRWQAVNAQETPAADNVAARRP